MERPILDKLPAIRDIWDGLFSESEEPEEIVGLRKAVKESTGQGDNTNVV